jgi:hypothetical protein
MEGKGTFSHDNGRSRTSAKGLMEAMVVSNEVVEVRGGCSEGCKPAVRTG